MRATLLLALGAPLILLAGCGRHQALILSSSPAGAQVMSNPATGEPSYVGRWAASAAACADRAWVLTRQGLHSADGQDCSFVRLDPGSAGYGGDVDCGREGDRKAGRMTLTLTGKGAARGLTVSGGPFSLPVGLTACAAAAPGPVVAAPRSASPA